MTTPAVTPRFGNNQSDGVPTGKMLYPFWELLNSTAYGAKVKTVDYADKTVHVYGTFGAGGSITIRGSNKENPVESTTADWFNLNDPSKTALTFTGAGGEQILENPLWISPLVTAGDGSTSINVAITAIKRL